MPLFAVILCQIRYYVHLKMVYFYIKIFSGIFYRIQPRIRDSFFCRLNAIYPA